MATVAYSVNYGNGGYVRGRVGNVTDALPATTAVDDAIAAYDLLAADTAAALATLVADGASPTQAHVTAVDDAYTLEEAGYDAIITAYDAYVAAVAAAGTANAADLVVLINNTNLDTLTKIVTAINFAKRDMGIPGA